MAVFKGSSSTKYAFATELGMVTACLVGNVMNLGKNFIAAVNTEGWLYLFDLLNDAQNSTRSDDEARDLTEMTTVPESTVETLIQDGEKVSTTYRLKLLHNQRLPANCKELLLADLDGDGQNELIVGLTDRVLRTYKWIRIGQDRGKFVGLYKWEFADQIGAVSLNPSRRKNCQDIIVAQPGGTYANLECFDKKPLTMISNSTSSSSSTNSEKKNSSQPLCTPIDQQQSAGGSSSDSPVNKGDNVRTEYISKLTPEYHQLALAQMRNHHVSTEVLGGIRDSKGSESYSSVVIATLDGTLMLVNEDEILWSLQVDHQLFAAAVLEIGERPKSRPLPTITPSVSSCTVVANSSSSDSKTQPYTMTKGEENDETSTGSIRVYESLSSPKQVLSDECKDMDDKPKSTNAQYFVVCAWNGKTYIIDEERNYLRFKFDEAVSAFTAGNYHFNGCDHPSLVYATFNNQIVLYYDVILDEIRPMYLLKELKDNPDHRELYEQLMTLARRLGHVSDHPSSFEQSQLIDATANSISSCSLSTLNKDDLEETPGTLRISGQSDSYDSRLEALLKEILYNIKESEIATV